MLEFPTIDYQRQLIRGCLDDFSANDALPNFMGGQFGGGEDIWRTAVIKFLCLNVESGLLEVTHQQFDVGRNVDKLRVLLVHGSKERDIDVDTMWNIVYFNGTEKLIALVKGFGLLDWGFVNSDINDNFIEKLADIYDKYSNH
jgi:hypothetical protein